MGGKHKAFMGGKQAFPVGGNVFLGWAAIRHSDEKKGVPQVWAATRKRLRFDCVSVHMGGNDVFWVGGSRERLWAAIAYGRQHAFAGGRQCVVGGNVHCLVGGNRAYPRHQKAPARSGAQLSRG